MNGQHDLLISYGYKANEADELIAVCSAKHDYITRSDSKGIKLTATAAPFMKLKAAHTDFTADSVVIGSGDELDDVIGQVIDVKRRALSAIAHVVGCDRGCFGEVPCMCL